MTAINPARLKIQSARLADLFQDPQRFIADLHDLLGFYSTRIRQTGLSQAPLSLQSYQVPTPVIHALALELKPKIASQPQAGISLVGTLWKQEWLEFHQLAVLCLGKLPPDDPDLILSTIQSWLDTSTAEMIRVLIMEAGLERLIESKPQKVLGLISGLIASGSRSDQQAALYGLSTLTERAGFENLPVIFKMLQDILARDDSGLIKEITALIRILQRQSDQETAFFLERQLGTAARPRIFRVVRGVLPKFSPESQALLKAALHNYS